MPEHANEAVSDTGEIWRNWSKGVATVNTPRSQVAMGEIGGMHIVLKDATFDISTRNATIAVQSLDNHPINSSSNLMISLGANAVPNGNQLPFRSEPVLGRISIHAHMGMSLYVNGKKASGPEAGYKDGRYVITLDPSMNTSWIMMR